MDPGIKIGPGRPKNQSSQNGFKTDVCIGLVVTNPMQLERAQTNTICEVITVCLYFQTGKILMTVQSVQFVQC
jgi:hypothetical protein